MRAVIRDVFASATHGFNISEEATASTVADWLAQDPNCPHDEPTRMRLIANGRELAPGDELSALGEYFFRKQCLTLIALDESACREWQRIGRCRLGCKCPLQKTHAVGLSPRYVAHQLNADSPPATPPPGTTADSVEPASRPPTPLMDAPVGGEHHPEPPRTTTNPPRTHCDPPRPTC